MALREIDAIGDAIIATEKEIAGAAWGDEQDDDQGEGGDRSLEDMGEGLEGQHEAGDDDETDGEDADGEAESDGEGDGEGETPPVAGKDGKGKEPEPIPPARGEQPEGGRVPSGKLREANERARTAETARDAVTSKLDEVTRTFTEKLDAAMRRIDDLSRTRTEPPKAVEPPKTETIPDIFEDPKGFAEHLTKGFQTELSKRDQQLANQRVETSMAIAHAFHKDTFEKAFDAINKLNVQNPEDRMAVQRIYNSPNPGEALVNWHKRNETFARVGDDPTKFEERIREETRQALLKDPEFRKQLIAEARRDATQGDNGTPRTVTRLPRSLNGAAGSNLGAERGDPHQYDDSDQGVADAAWR